MPATVAPAAWLAALAAGEEAAGARTSVFLSRLPEPALLAAAGVAALLALVWWVGRAQPVDGGRGFRRLLSGLRLAAAALLALALLGPAVRSERKLSERACLYLLVDESQSMLLRDRYAPSERAAVAALLGPGAPARPDRMSLANAAKLRLARAAGGRFRVETYAFAERLRPRPAVPDPAEARRAAAADLAPSGAETRLGSCLAELLAQTGGQPVAGVVVLSDGCSNAGAPVSAAAEAARARGIPVHAVATGSAAEPRDLAVRELAAPQVCLKGDPVLFRARLGSAGYPARSVEAVLEEDGQPVRRQQVSLPAGGGEEIKESADAGAAPRHVTAAPVEVSLEISHTPEKPGMHVYTLALPLQEDEALAENNRASALVRVEDARTRVLLVAGEPGWEYRCLVAALSRDKTMESSCYLQSADPTYPQEGSRPIARFPRGEADLYAYDVVILCGPDPNPVDFSADFVAGLKKFVDERGGGLVFAACRQPSPYAFKGQRAEELLEMLPAELDLSRDQSEFGKRAFKTPWRVRPAPEAAELPLLRLDDDPAENARVWAELPELYWSYPLVRLRPAATRLLLRPDAGQAGGAVAAAHFYGAGQVALLATDNLWRWRLSHGDRFYYRFWAQLIRHAAAGSVIGRSRPVQISADRALYRPGEKAELRAAVKRPAPAAPGAPEGAGLVPLRQDSVDLVVQRVAEPGAEAVRAVVKLRPVPDRPGTYSGSYAVGAAGTYEVWMPDAPRIGPPPGEAPPGTAPGGGSGQAREERPGLARFDVRLPARESGDLRVNREEFAALAAATGGSCLDAGALGGLEALVGAIPESRRERAVQAERDVWDALPLLALALAALGAEWALRKQRGML